MTSDTYKQEWQKGASQIIEKAEKLAQRNGIKFEKAEWNHDHSIVRRSKHVLSLTANGRTIPGEFADEWVRDYPGEVGREKANAVLSIMIHKLRE